MSRPHPRPRREVAQQPVAVEDEEHDESDDESGDRQEQRPAVVGKVEQLVGADEQAGRDADGNGDLEQRRADVVGPSRSRPATPRAPNNEELDHRRQWRTGRAAWPASLDGPPTSVGTSSARGRHSLPLSASCPAPNSTESRNGAGHPTWPAPRHARRRDSFDAQLVGHDASMVSAAVLGVDVAVDERRGLRPERARCRPRRASGRTRRRRAGRRSARISMNPCSTSFHSGRVGVEVGREVAGDAAGDLRLRRLAGVGELRRAEVLHHGPHLGCVAERRGDHAAGAASGWPSLPGK